MASSGRSGTREQSRFNLGTLSKRKTTRVNAGSTGCPEMRRSHPIRFGLTMPPRELTREHANPAVSTFNPKVAGSIPARPIQRMRLQGFSAMLVVNLGNRGFISSQVVSVRCSSLQLVQWDFRSHSQHEGSPNPLLACMRRRGHGRGNAVINRTEGSCGDPSIGPRPGRQCCSNFGKSNVFPSIETLV